MFRSSEKETREEKVHNTGYSSSFEHNFTDERNANIILEIRNQITLQKQ